MAPAREMDPVFFKLFNLQPSKADRRRIQIIEAAIDCIATVGIDQTTLDKVAKRVKVSRSHATYYFPTRENMLQAVFQYVIAICQSVTVAHLEGVKKSAAKEDTRALMTAVVEAPFIWLAQYPKHAAVTSLFYYFGMVDAKVRKLGTDFRLAGFHRIAAVVETLPGARKHPAARRKAAALEAAKAIHGVMTAYLLEVHMINPTMTYDEYRGAAVRASEAILESFGCL